MLPTQTRTAEQRSVLSTHARAATSAEREQPYVATPNVATPYVAADADTDAETEASTDSSASANGSGRKSGSGRARTGRPES